MQGIADQLWFNTNCTMSRIYGNQHLRPISGTMTDKEDLKKATLLGFQVFNISALFFYQGSMDRKLMVIDHIK